jgi:hypothetical protein
MSLSFVKGFLKLIDDDNQMIPKTGGQSKDLTARSFGRPNYY